MVWIVLALVALAVVIVARIYFNARRVQLQGRESWDAKLISTLRSRGYAPFNDYPVDFFLALPDEQACAAVRHALEAEGYSVDVKPVPDDPELHFSLHATKATRLILEIIQEHGQRMTQLATEHHGRYDGWTA
jgi:hypothetical protein